MFSICNGEITMDITDFDVPSLYAFGFNITSPGNPDYLHVVDIMEYLKDLKGEYSVVVKQEDLLDKDAVYVIDLTVNANHYETTIIDFAKTAETIIQLGVDIQLNFEEINGITQTSYDIGNVDEDEVKKILVLTAKLSAMTLSIQLGDITSAVKLFNQITNLL